MAEIDRRQFAAALAALGTAALAAPAAGEEKPLPRLPTVRWGKYEITRALVGHNPIKGVSHSSRDFDREIRDYFAADPRRGPELLRRCEQLGMNTCQMGSEPIERILRDHYAEGGRLQWIATFYSLPGKGDEELARVLKMNPRPIGIQQLGNTSDALMKAGKIDLALENLKRFRDAGLLVGLGSHNHEVIDYAESKGWDVDFYQCCFYRSVFDLKPTAAKGEVFAEEARQSMTRTIRQVSKPCIAFKVLGAGRHCGSPESIEAALKFAYENIKPSDVVLLGMWQKYKDQAAENIGLVRKILKS